MGHGWKLIRSGELFDHILASLWRVVRGYTLAAVSAVGLGFPFAWCRGFAVVTASTFEFLRPIPPIALIPLALLYSIKDGSKIFIIFYVCFWPIFLNTVLGVREVDPILIKLARVLEFNNADLLRKVMLPAASPSIMTGLRIRLAISLIALVASEMIAAERGLGYLILDSERVFDTPRMFVGIVVIAILGLITNALSQLIERHVLKYRY